MRKITIILICMIFLTSYITVFRPVKTLKESGNTLYVCGGAQDLYSLMSEGEQKANVNYTYYRKVIVNHTYVDTNLTDFPVVINISCVSNHVQNDFDDVCFNNSDNSTILSHEIEKTVVSSVNSSLAFTDDGAWCWFTDPRAVHYENNLNKTYAGWVTSSGDIVVGEYNHSNDTFSMYTLHSNYQIDDHCNPSILIRNDSHIMVFYSKHGSSNPVYRVSTKAEDISSWELEKTISTGGGCTYTFPVQLSSEDNKIYLFYRRSGAIRCRNSTDNGQTWGSETSIMTVNGVCPYMKLETNNSDTIWMAFSEWKDPGDSDPVHNDTWFMKYYDHKFYKADGTLIGSWDDLPFTKYQCDMIYNSSDPGHHRCWIWDIAVNETYTPTVVFATFVQEQEHHYNLSFWNGTDWELHGLCKAGTSLYYPTENHETSYSGGIYLDHENTSIVYLSRNDIFDNYEIQKVTTIDRWQTKTFENITYNSSQKNFRPVTIRNHTSDLYLLWLSGRYTTYTNYKTSIMTNKKINVNIGGNTYVYAWVKIPHLSSKEDTVIWLNYGNSSCSNQQDIFSVWDNHYVLVQHLNENIGSYEDSTINNNNGILIDSDGNSRRNATGVVGNCIDFSGDDYIIIPDDDTLYITTEMTTELWIDRESWNYRTRPFGHWHTSDQGWLYHFEPQRTFRCYLGNNGSVSVPETTIKIPSTGWSYTAAVYNSGTIYFYINNNTESITGLQNTLSAHDNPQYIGAGYNPLGGDNFNGLIDEVRISNIARNQSWINTTYNTISYPTNFLSLGNEQTQEKPSNNNPINTNPYPSDYSSDTLLNPILVITVNDADGDTMNVTFKTNASGSWKDIDTKNNVSNGTYQQYSIGMSQYNTKYYWSVNTSDGHGGWDNDTYSFTTKLVIITENLYVEINKTAGEIVKIGKRKNTSSDWYFFNISIFGEYKNNINEVFTTLDITPFFYNLTPALNNSGYYLYKYELYNDTSNIYWNFWFEIPKSGYVFQCYRTFWTEADVYLNGVGVVFENKTGYQKSSRSSITYSEYDVLFDGGYIDMNNSMQGLRIYLGDTSSCMIENESTNITYWYANTSTRWDRDADYKRLSFVFYDVGDNLTEYQNTYAKQWVFSKKLTTPSLVGSFLTRTRTSGNSDISWKNEIENSFWQSDWQTGNAIGCLLYSWHLNESSTFFLQRAIDLTDINIDHGYDRFHQSGVHNDYYMGKGKWCMEIMDIINMPYYGDVANDSLNWYISNADKTPCGAIDPNNVWVDNFYNKPGYFNVRDIFGNDADKAEIRTDCQCFMDYLWNESYNLYYHYDDDWAVWGRGTGWIMTSIPRYLQYADPYNFSIWLNNYQTFTDSVISYQTSNGAWKIDLIEMYQSSQEEASATSMISAGLIGGFVKGCLNVTALDAGLKGLSWLVDNIDLDGRLKYTQQPAGAGAVNGSCSSNAEGREYAQEGFVQAVAWLGVKEVVNSNTIIQDSFDDGVIFLTDMENITVKDCNNEKITVNENMVLLSYNNSSQTKRNLNIKGNGIIDITLYGFLPNMLYKINNTNMTSSTTSVIKMSDSNGNITLNLNLTGNHTISITLNFTPYPILFNEFPINNSKNQAQNPLLLITVIDQQGNLENISFYTNASGSWKLIGYNATYANGTYCQLTSNMNNYATSYFWSVNASDDEGYWTNETFKFSTSSTPVGWYYYKIITINHSLVDTNLVNFPVLVNIVNDTDLHNRSQNNGEDIKFMNATSGGIQYNHEIEYYNDDGTYVNASIWVNITYVSSSENTVFYMFYGNNTCDSQESIVDTWESNYISVLHLCETSGNHYDSTAYTNNGITSSINHDALGIIDGADEFDSNTDYIQVSTNSLSIGSGTISVWGFPYSFSDEDYFFGHTTQPAFGNRIQLYTDDVNGNLDLGLGISHIVDTNIIDLDTNTWYYIALTWNDSYYVVYVNGINESYGPYSGLTSFQSFLDIGNNGNSGGSRDNGFDGLIDEYRASKINRNASWINTTYNTIRKSSDFINISDEFMQIPNYWNNTVRVIPHHQYVSHETSFSIDINCTPAQEIRGFQFNLSFNSSILNADSICNIGEIFTSQNYTIISNYTINNIRGNVSYVYASILGFGNVSTPGRFATINFTANNNLGTSFLNLYNVKIVNLTHYLNVLLYNGSVTIPPNYDINIDGIVDILDINMASILFGQTVIPGSIREDVDNNGIIDVLDLSIVSYYFGQTWI